MNESHKRSISGTNKRVKAQKSGFKKTNIPLDRGYVKPTKDGGRLHKYSKNGKIHKDTANPVHNPLRHVKNDVILKNIKKIIR